VSVPVALVTFASLGSYLCDAKTLAFPIAWRESATHAPLLFHGLLTFAAICWICRPPTQAV
jgi:hypothetical protein